MTLIDSKEFQESPLYSRTYDLLLWLIPQAQKFPRAHRFGVAERIQTLLFNFQDLITAAGKETGNARRDLLRKADINLAQLRVWMRLSRDMSLLSLSQYEHGSGLLSEVGKLLGAWIKKCAG